MVNNHPYRPVSINDLDLVPNSEPKPAVVEETIPVNDSVKEEQQASPSVSADDMQPEDTASAASARRGLDIPSYRDSEQLDMQMGGSSGDGEDASDRVEIPITQPKQKKSQPKTKEPKSPSAYRPKGSSGVVQVRDIPRDVMTYIRSQIPDARNNADALSAYVIIKSGNLELSMSPDVEKLVVAGLAVDETARMSQRLSRVEQLLFDLNQQSKQSYDQTELALAYLILDRMGFRTTQLPATPDQMDFVDPNLFDLVKSLRHSVRRFRNEQMYRTGRTIR